SMPDHRFPRKTDRLSLGTTRQTCAEREVKKSFTRGSLRVRVLPLMAVISPVCITERHRGTTFTAAALALATSKTLIPPAPVLGPSQEKVGCRLKNCPS